MSKSAADDAAVINVPTRSIAFRGETLVVTPLTLTRIGPFITAARSVIGRAVVAIGYAKAGGELETGALVLDLLEQDHLAVAQALAVATDRDAAWIADAPLEESAELVAAVVALNRDFFARRLPGLLVQARQAMPETTTAGPTSSSSSSPTGTDTPTS